jgi:uncharacterized protein with FMN-binding domain
VSPRRRHVAAWTLSLAACAGAVAARVLVGGQPPPTTLASTPAHGGPPARVRTVTRTQTVVVTVPRVRRATPTRTAAPAPARRRAPRAPAPVTRAAATPKPRPKPARPRRRASTQHAEGDAVPTRYGAVQVRLAMRGRRIVDIAVLAHPDDLERSRQIDADALPKLRQQVLAAQGADIDGVAGATYTSQGYRQSVQSALDLA